jgi:hypothetical protein
MQPFSRRSKTATVFTSNRHPAKLTSSADTPARRRSNSPIQFAPLPPQRDCQQAAFYSEPTT